MGKKTTPKSIHVGISEYLAKLGRKGGKARLHTMTPEQRSEAARKAGLAGGRGRKREAK